MKNISQSIKCIVKSSTCELQKQQKVKKKLRNIPQKSAIQKNSAPSFYENLHRKIVKIFFLSFFMCNLRRDEAKTPMKELSERWEQLFQQFQEALLKLQDEIS